MKKLGKYFAAVIFVSVLAAIAGCSQPDERVGVAKVGQMIASSTEVLRKDFATLKAQETVLKVQVAAKDVAKSVVSDNRLRQISACGEMPARLQYIGNYHDYDVVANESYRRACADAVIAAKAKDRQLVAEQKRLHQLAKAKSRSVAKTHAKAG